MGCDGWGRRTGTDFSLCEKLPADSVPVSFSALPADSAEQKSLGEGGCWRERSVFESFKRRSAAKLNGAYQM